MRNLHNHLTLAFILATIGINQGFLHGQEQVEIQLEEQPTEFLRLKTDDQGRAISLQTSITRYHNRDRTLVVDLIGAVHVGETAYYKSLNQQFGQYQSLLYELVAPQGTRIPAGGKRETGMNPLSLLQGSMQSMLGLESQLERIDYQKENFVHADLSPEQMQAKMAERGDTALTLGLSAITEMMRQQNLAQRNAANGIESDDIFGADNLFEVMGDSLKMKQMMAKQFASSGALEMGLGQRLSQLIVDDRNAACMDVLNRQIVDGKTKIGIFYGAAHMPDFEDRLERLGMVKGEQVWVDAWDLTKSNAKEADNAMPLMLNLLEQLSK